MMLFSSIPESEQADLFVLLNQNAVFVCLDQEEIRRIVTLAHFEFYKEGELIVQEGNYSPDYHFIVRGRVKIVMNSLSGKEFIIDIRSRGETFGDLAALDGQPHFASSQALEDTLIMALKRDDLVSIIQLNPAVERNILLAGSFKLRNSYGKLISLVGETVEQRLIKLLLGLLSKYGANLNFNHKEIAEMIGTTNETSTRILTQLRKRGALRSTRGKIIILDENILRSLIP